MVVTMSNGNGQFIIQARKKTNSSTTDDLTLLSDITIETVNFHLLKRYEEDQVYTYSGSILISVNPYKELFIYDEATMTTYHSENKQNLKPHIFSIAECAYQSLKRSSLTSLTPSRCNQSIVISGESGAGKTETTKFILNYLCHIITSNVNTWVEHQILEANTILEAFGNAKTVRNDNSSRFGKFMQVCFDSKWMIKGCIIQDYLLEQSRITQQNTEERNYHVFYLLLQDAMVNPELQKQYRISPKTNYNYLNNPQKHSESDTLSNLQLAFQILQIPPNFIDSIFKTLSAILWLGNLNFVSNENEKSELTEDSLNISKTIAELLELKSSDLVQVLLTRQINVRGNITEIPLREREAVENRHAMAKALYSKTFAWLIFNINRRINPSENEENRFLGLLDIFGFENFQTNSFEQFCINYTNEKLHKFFNQEVFKIEQEIYKSEGIKYSHIEFTDNTVCLELIEKTPRCLLKLLTEQCHLPKGSDSSYLTNITTEFQNIHPCFQKPEDRRLWETEFTILHYAGPVTYKVLGFVDKNRDVQQDLFFHFLSDSKSEFIQQLCNLELNVLCDKNNKNVGTNKCKPTVADAFKLQLQSLVDVLTSTQPWYVRCIKPNMTKSPDSYDECLVLDQLKYLGMLEIIRIRREGYPVHIIFKDFVKKYSLLGKFRTYREDKKSVVKEILDWLGSPNTDWQLGHSKVFVKGKVHEVLESKRIAVLDKCATKIQTLFRGHRVRKGYKNRLAATLKIQSCYKTWKIRISYLKKRRAAITIQSHLRGMFAREVAVALREMRRVEEGIKKKREEIHSRRQSQANLTDYSNTDSEDGNNAVEQTELKDMTDADLENLLEFLGGDLSGEESDYDIDRESPPALPPVPDTMPPLPVPPISVSQIMTPAIIPQIRPTLPEPTVRPPPVPQLLKPVVKPVVKQIKSQANGEPIYESIKPRIEPEFTKVENYKKEMVTMSKPVQPVINNIHRNIVTKKLQDLTQQIPQQNPQKLDLITYALNYFNDWPEPTSLLKRPLNNPSQTNLNLIPKTSMIVYTDSNNIPSSHLHLYDPSNIPLSLTIFKDLQKYNKSEFKPEIEIQFIQNLISYGLQKEELRDEIYIQIVRLINMNSNLEQVDKLMQLICFVSVCFPPGKILVRFLVCFFNEFCEFRDKCEFVLGNFTFWNKQQVVRSFFPSSVEIKALQKLGTIVCRIFFLDARTCAIDIHPMDTSATAMKKLSEKLGLANLDNSWAIYNTTNNGDEIIEEHVPMHSFLYDVISQWEIDGKNNKNSENNKFVFKKRLFLGNCREIPQDPVEVNLLFSQAVCGVVKLDAYPISEKVCLQLAGLQLQIQLNEYKQNQTENYTNIENYLPQRILRNRPNTQWTQILEQAHRQYGSGKSELVSKVWYLSCVMQYPLYGHTLFYVNYRGYWIYGNALLLGISNEAISMIKQEDKFIIYQYTYNQIESIAIETSENLLTINLKKSLPPDTHKCFVFETRNCKEILNLITSYYPLLAKNEILANNIKLSITNEDRYRLFINLITCRKLLVENRVLKKFVNQSNLIHTIKRRLSKDKFRVFNVPFPYESDFPCSYFRFSKYPIGSSLSNIEDYEENNVAVGVFLLLLQFSGVNGPALNSPEEEASHLQSILEKCWRKESLINEIYLQLIKQTSDHPEPNSKINEKNWSMLSLICSLVPPSNSYVRKYLFAHLKRCGMSDGVTLEGRYARFAEKCLSSTINGIGTGPLQQQRRQWSPSKQEILCTINCRPITSRFYLMDGKYHVLNFTPNDTASDLLISIMKKIGLSEGVKGYSLYELGTNAWERSLLPTERPVEVMARWEKQRSSNSNLQFKFVMKKHLFVESELHDPVEKELVYHQLLHQARNDRFPVSDTEAAMLVALQAQVELGDYRSSSSPTAVGEFPDYCHVSAHCLPTRIAASVSHEAVARHHQSLVGTPSSQAKQTVLNLLRSWPMHRASIYDVTQSFTSNWPRSLWLAVDQTGVHLLQQRTRHTLCSFEYETIISYSPSPTCFMLVTNGDSGKQSKIILSTNQGYQISQLIKEYILFVFNQLKHTNK